MTLKLRKDLEKVSDSEKAKVVARYFKTGKGEYGEGDVFVGASVPECWIIARRYCEMPIRTVEILLRSKIHEERFIALMILVLQFNSGSLAEKEKIFKFYLANTKYVNNWDLVDTSADHIVGGYLKEIPNQVRNDIFEELVRSKNIWERRIAIIATYEFIRNNNFEPTLQISENLLSDSHDLIHKAVGWMLREVGKRDKRVLEQFLRAHLLRIPRTTLRYAIERFPQSIRKSYLAKNSY